MDQRTRSDDLTELMATWADNVLSRVRIAVPVKLVKDSDGQTVEAQPQIQGLALQPDGTTKFIDLPSFADMPINSHGGGGITTTHAHKEGDEGLALMTQQAFEVWFQRGGIQQPGDVRMHALSDAFYVPGVRNQTRALKGVSTTSTQTRTDDKQTVLDVSHMALTSVRKDTAHQVNDNAVQSQKGSSSHVVDAQGIQSTGGKFFWNC
ncbi:hypothetical protein SAMN05216360_12530 [Methylobacterium phyllostachyos]|uniref:Phage protein Gp138 N-terminal domain-containing protein n=1 Tax=Methylobacterium phyllostachyos TaxID=582672 RepID=A0A1H0K7L9_9HYPH|nr:Gp138 family membrane-puncturing spike protein [Methylobacterium phyllostachyos]SDO51867.1 hypothetical protein SAMN05216360_12530 [Methylobacterium phyllostachyos]